MQHHQPTSVTKRFEKHIPVNAPGQIAIDVLAGDSVLSRQQLKQCFACGAVWLQKGRQVHRLRRVKKKLSPGEILHLYYDPDIVSRPVPQATLLQDLKHYSVWSKPAGMLAQGSLWGDHCSLLRVSEQAFTPAREAFLVHRLDREAFGLMLIAHHKKAAAALSTLFQSRQLHKQYWVKLQGQLSAERLTLSQPLDGKAAITHLQLAHYEATDDTSIVRVEIETGRKHQIRRHCQSIGHPVIGDRRYGSLASTPLQLQAAYLAFECPLTRQKQVFSRDNQLEGGIDIVNPPDETPGADNRPK